MRALRRLLIVPLALIACGSCASTAVAAECTDVWEGPVSGDWMTAEYWSTEAIPNLRRCRLYSRRLLGIDRRRHSPSSAGP